MTLLNYFVEPVFVSQDYRVGFVIWFFFFAGMFFHVLGRAHASVSSKLTGTSSYEQWFTLNAVPLLIRLFAGCLVIMIWAYQGDLFTLALNLLLSPLGATKLPPLPLIPPIAGMFGLAFDFLADFALSRLPSMRKEVPPEDK